MFIGKSPGSRYKTLQDMLFEDNKPQWGGMMPPNMDMMFNNIMS